MLILLAAFAAGRARAGAVAGTVPILSGQGNRGNDNGGSSIGALNDSLKGTQLTLNFNFSMARDLREVLQAPPARWLDLGRKHLSAARSAGSGRREQEQRCSPEVQLDCPVHRQLLRRLQRLE